MSGFEMFVVRKITAVILLFMTLINSITGVGTVMEKPADINGSLVCTDALGRTNV